MEKQVILIEARREGYSVSQVGFTMTAGELISVLQDYNEDTPIYLSHDNGYTYGGISGEMITDELVDVDEDED